MSEKAITIRKTAAFTIVSVFLLASTFAILDFSGDLAQNALSGAIEGAISGLVVRKRRGDQGITSN